MAILASADPMAFLREVRILVLASSDPDNTCSM